MEATPPEKSQMEDNWSHLIKSIHRRLIDPWKHPTFILYFFGIVVVIGCFGVWWPILFVYPNKNLSDNEKMSAVAGSLYTLFIGIAATATTDHIIGLKSKNEKSLAMFFIICSVAVGVCGLIAAVLTFKVTDATDQSPRYALDIAAFGLVLALVLWWTANARNCNLQDTSRPDATLGGDPDADLSGNLAGIIH